MSYLLAAAGIKAGGALAKYGIQRYQNAKRRYSGTAMGKELAKIKKEGALSPELQNNIIGKQNRTLSSQAGTIQAQTQGNLINQGLEGSIAGTRALAQPNIERMRELGYTSRDLKAQNEQSKIDAGLKDAELRTAYNQDTKDQRLEANMGLATSAIDIGTEYVAGKYAQDQADDAKALEQKRYDQARANKVSDAELEYKRQLEINKPDELKLMEAIQQEEADALSLETEMSTMKPGQIRGSRSGGGDFLLGEQGQTGSYQPDNAIQSYKERMLSKTAPRLGGANMVTGKATMDSIPPDKSLTQYGGIAPSGGRTEQTESDIRSQTIRMVRNIANTRGKKNPQEIAGFQTLLNEQGYRIPVTGKLDSKTVMAFKLFYEMQKETAPPEYR